MNGENRGVTWVEVLVVVIVVGVLAILAVSYLLRQREAARREMCQLRQEKIADALIERAQAQGSFPGYVNLRAKGEPVSWVISILADLGHEQLAGAWAEGAEPVQYLPELVCPADPPEGAQQDLGPLSYVVNCGRPGDDALCDGVFFNHTVAEPLLMTRDYLRQHDGESEILLLSENVQAGRWTDTSEADLGMVWVEKPQPCSPINRCLDAGDRPQEITYARPSSFHPGGVNATYCDGRGRFLSQQLDYRVYQQMMAVDAAAAGLVGAAPENSPPRPQDSTKPADGSAPAGPEGPG